MKRPRNNSPTMRRATTLLLLLLTTLTLSLLHIIPTASAIEATFTPNPQDSLSSGGDGGPLPLSMNQRKQLLELEVAIVNSQDPTATLNHVANQNQMSQEELIGMLDRNRRDLESTGQLESMVSDLDVAAIMAGAGGGGAGGGGVGSTLPRRMVSLVVSMVMAIAKTASVQISRNPKQSTLLAMLLLSSYLAVHNAPKNGIVISTGALPPLSRGHTTILMPPMDYLMQRYVDYDGWESSLPAPRELKTATETTSTTKKGKSGKSNSTTTVGGVGMTNSLPQFMDASSPSSEMEVQVETRRGKDEGYTLITTAHKLVSVGDDILSDLKKKNIDNDNDDGEDEVDWQQEAMDCMLESISSIFDDRKFAEFIPEKSCTLKFRSFLVAAEDDGEGSDEEDAQVMEGAVMAMKLLGDFGRYGIQPLCTSYEMEEDEQEESMVRCVAFHTLKGGHFDGEIRFSMEEKKPTPKKKKGSSKKSSSKESSGVLVRVTLAIPKGGRSPPVRLAEMMVSSLAQSIAQSSQIKMKQTLARRSQSKSYRATAGGRAAQKRHLRYEQEKNQEEMAVERKRRWKRNNPDAGHYRPSGHMMRSPHNR